MTTGRHRERDNEAFDADTGQKIGGKKMNKVLAEHNTLSTNALKIWAIIAMACDHIPYLSDTWSAQYYTMPWVLMHMFGRITAPVFFYLLALGYRRTRNPNRYTARLLAFALISYLPYIWYFKSSPVNAQNFLELNVIFTMLAGLLLLRAIHEIRNTALKAVLIVLCLLLGYWCDYGLYGVALILVCDIARDSRRATVLGMGAVMMVYVTLRTQSFFTSDLSPFDYLPIIMYSPFAKYVIVLLLCQLIPLILIARHRVWAPAYVSGAKREARPGFLARWGFYIFYPAHITVLLLISLY